MPIIQINLPFITFDPQELGHWLIKYLKKFTKTDSLLSHIADSTISDALTNAVTFLLHDRHGEDVGKGGWGKSDREYMKRLYGQKAAESGPPDSVMSTVVAVRALQAYAGLLRRSEVPRVKTFDDAWDKVREELAEYLSRRWDCRMGWGGTLAQDREGTWSLRPSYRHTSWLLTVWLELPGYWHNSLVTINSLTEQFNEINWKEEKVATPVAAHYALTLALCASSLQKVLDVERLTFLLRSFEDIIVSKYDRHIQGWTSGLDRRGGRQIYTLFTLADMAHSYRREGSVLGNVMDEAMKATVSGEWKATQEGGFSWVPGETPNLNISCLAMSALLRKNLLSPEEKEARNRVVSYVVNRLAQSSLETLEGTYGWTLSYFVKDVCDILTGFKRD